MKTTLIISFVLIAFSAFAQEPLPYLNTKLSFEERAADLVSRMTLEEKVLQMVHNAPAIERLGVPEYNWWNECLHGVARAGIATVYPQAVGMASMWDTLQMRRIGNAISDEARAKHHAFVARDKRLIYMGLTYWTPNINIFRDPRWGRGMETYGEDPYLTGELAVPFIQALQGNDPRYFKLIATAKHFVVHSGPEGDRHRFDAIATERDFLETYTPHFKKAFQQGNAYSVMCAYNRYMGQPCCGSKDLDNLLRKDWGFKGYTVSDCWAIVDFHQKGHHEVVDTPEEAAAMAVKAGTDLNCGSTYPHLVSAVKKGLITEAEIDVSVTRLMLARMKLGMFDPQEQVPYASIPYSVVDSEAHRQLALETARKSMVLLKNDRQTLPFSKQVKKVAVIGPNANNLEVLLGNYNGHPSSPVTILEGIKAKLPNASVAYAPGCQLADEMPSLTPIPAVSFTTDGTQPGLTAQYYNNSRFEGAPAHVVVDPAVNFLWWTNAPFNDLAYDNFSVRWSGMLVPPTSGRYAIGGEAMMGCRLWVNDSLLIGKSEMDRDYYAFVDFKAGEKYKIVFEASFKDSEYVTAKLLWQVPNANLQADALALAKASDVVVLCMGLSPLLEGEEMDVPVKGFNGGDRTDIELPESQRRLTQAIMALNKPTVMVLLNGSAIAINQEAENMPAILEAWYPGQAGGTAVADVLWGDYNPAGRLPVTFYKSVNDLPGFNDYSMRGRTYRYYGGTPLYAFGHGLSYTTFTYSRLVMPKQIAADQLLTVAVDVTNSGKMDGDEVVQLYVSHPGQADAPIRSLQAFSRIHLKAGETRRMTYTLSPEQLKMYNADNCLELPNSGVKISVGGAQPDKSSLDKKQVVEQLVKVKK
jgi:beta-glucosidase